MWEIRHGHLIPPLVPREVADLRPAADAAATARTVAHPAALAQGLAVAPVLPSQGGLVARGFLEPRPVSPAGTVAGSDQAPDRSSPRVLKPWGVPMLPAEEETPPCGRAGGSGAASEARPREAGRHGAEDLAVRDPVAAVTSSAADRQGADRAGGSVTPPDAPPAEADGEGGEPKASAAGEERALPELASGPEMLRVASPD